VAASCSDGIRNGTETDIDCGGACAPCDDGRTCTAARDCTVGSCFAGRCGERMWFVESQGTTIAVPGDQLWVAAPGLRETFTLYTPSNVYLRWTGTSRYAGGGNELCHVGQRFVIDGMPTGHPTWGNAIMVQRGATRWHEAFNVELVVPLEAGEHTISAEMLNANGYATCNLDGEGGEPYNRSRLAVAAFEPDASWYAESTGSTGPLAGGSGWVDIPGTELTFPLAETSLVQVSLQGTQLVQGTGSGHCAYRLVVDGTPLGNPNHGQAISVGDAAGGWWAPVAIKWGVAMLSGEHTIKAQVRNSSAVADTCEAGQGNNVYARFRLFASASAPGISQALESTGGSQYFGSNSAWTPISGLSTSVELGSTPANLLVELAGTQRTVSGSGHCAYRLVIDDVPLGHPSHGQAINVGDGSTTWWTHIGLVWGAKLSPGRHFIRAEARNSSSSGDCGINGDGEPYGRVRMLVRHL
jgi:hypothetical protein